MKRLNREIVINIWEGTEDMTCSKEIKDWNKEHEEEIIQ